MAISQEVRMKRREPTTNLQDGGRNPYSVNESRYGFGARDGDRIVLVHVSDLALDALEPSADRRSNYLGILMRHRGSIFEGAKRLYRDGRVEPSDVIFVKAGDIRG